MAPPDIMPTREPDGSLHLPFLQRIADLQTAHFSAEEVAEYENDRKYKMIGGSGGRPRYWTRQGKIVIPSTALELIREVLEAGHERHHHGGIHDLEERTSHFYWLNKDDAIRHHINTCGACQVNRAPRLGGPRGAPHINNSGRPMDRVIVDHVPMGTKSIEGYTAFITFTDVFTRWTEAYPVVSLDAPDALSALQYFRTRHSLPRVLQVDNHGAFKGEFEDYCKKNGVTVKRIESYHAEANAKGERPHGVIREKLKAYCGVNGKYNLWAQALPFIMEACMTMKNRSIGMTPFMALYGRSHTSTFDLLVGAEYMGLTVEQYRDVIHAVQDTLGLRDELRSDLQHHELTKGEKAPKFGPGDEVVLWFPTRESKDYSYYQKGYEVVAETRPDFYLIQRRELDGTIGKRETVPVKRLRAFKIRADAEDGGQYADVKDGHRVVDAIIDHTVRDGRYKFKVKWRQFGPDLGDGERVTPYAELRSLMSGCELMLREYCEKNGIKYYKLALQRAAEKREASERAAGAGDE